MDSALALLHLRYCRWWKAQRTAGVRHSGFESWLYHYLALGIELVNLPSLASLSSFVNGDGNTYPLQVVLKSY